MTAGITVCCMLVTALSTRVYICSFESHCDSRKVSAVVSISQKGKPKHKANCPRPQCLNGHWQSWESKKLGVAWSMCSSQYNRCFSFHTHRELKLREYLPKGPRFSSKCHFESLFKRSLGFNDTEYSYSEL